MYTPEEFLKDLTTTIVLGTREGYASGRRDLETKEADGSTSIKYSRGGFLLHDNWFGGEPYGGRITVAYQGSVCWLMGYHGYVYEGNRDITDQIYKFLLNALQRIPFDMPFRGPESFSDPESYYEEFKGWHYSCSVEGDLLRFSGREMIYRDELAVYEGHFVGGEVNLIP